MIRNFKIMGLALVAALSMSAVAASGASAVDFTAENPADYPVSIDGAQATAHEFKAGGTVKCNTALFTSDPEKEASETLTVQPQYTNCTAFGFIGSTITGFGHLSSETGDTCDYVFHASGKVDLECEGSAEVTIDAGPCVVHIPEQTNLTNNTFTNNTPAAGEVRVDTNVTGIKYTMTKESFLCPVAGGTREDGTYTGTTNVTGTNEEGEQVGIDVG